MKYIYLINNAVQEIIPEISPVFPDIPIEQRYSPDFLANCIVGGEETEVQSGWIYDPETNTFSEPPAPEPIAPPAESAPDLTALKSDRIAETKTALADYLEAHPIQWSDGKHYSVTAEKQSLLNNTIAVYQIGVQAGHPAELTWNATGEECAVWEFADLCALALAIAAYVKPLVAHQQALEVAIMAAETAEEVSVIEIDYAAVT